MINVNFKPDVPKVKSTGFFKEKKKYLGTRPNLGFSVSGMLVHCLKSGEEDAMRLDKQFGMGLKPEDVSDIPDLFFDVKRSGPVRRDLAESVIAKMHQALQVQVVLDTH